MSTKIHPKNVHKNSPKKRNSCGQKCPWEFTKSVHENLLFLSTKIRLLCPREVCHPLCTCKCRVASGYLTHSNLKETLKTPKVYLCYCTDNTAGDVSSWYGSFVYAKTPDLMRSAKLPRHPTVRYEKSDSKSDTLDKIRLIKGKKQDPN